MNQMWVVLFSIAIGFSVSGIVANLYRVLGFKAVSRPEHILRALVLVIAGPCVLVENALAGVLGKQWKLVHFWTATAGAAYWSLAIGLFVLEVALKF